MEAYLKRFTDFKTYAKLVVLDYDAVIDSIYDEQSTFTVVGDTEIIPGDFFICSEFIGKVLEVTPGESTTVEIKCSGILSFFDRPLVYGSDGTYAESFIAAALTDSYKSVADAQYAMPYLTITHAASSAFIKPDVADGFYSLKSYIAKARRVKNVFVTFSVTGDSLAINIATKSPATATIMLNDGRHEQISETISSASVAKITTLQEDGAGGYTEAQWYLNTDGNITNSPPVVRVDGAWIGLTLMADAVAADEVKNEFAKNSFSHKIEFRSSQKYNFYSPIIIKTKNRVLASYISAIRTDSADSRYLYKTGELGTTLTDKLKEMI